MSTQKNPEIMNSILEAIGNTPLVRLNKIARAVNADVLVKCEHLNPSGSIKDRMALQMVVDAEAEDKINPGLSVISTASSGNTAQALAMVGAIKGYQVKVRFEEATAHPEKTRPLDRYGAEYEVVTQKDEQADKIARAAGLHGASIEIPGRLRCLEEEESAPNHLWIRQYCNPSNIAAQSEVGKEILAQTDGKIDVFIASIGTGGTFLGISRVLKETFPHIKCIAVQPLGWEGWEDPLSPERKYIPGISGGILEEIRDSGIADEVAFVTSEEARRVAYQLSSQEGIYCGMSSGANVHMALKEAEKSMERGKVIVTIIVDRGDRYLADERYVT